MVRSCFVQMGPLGGLGILQLAGAQPGGSPRVISGEIARGFLGCGVEGVLVHGVKCGYLQGPHDLSYQGAGLGEVFKHGIHSRRPQRLLDLVLPSVLPRRPLDLTGSTRERVRGLMIKI